MYAKEWVPITPGGTALYHLASETKKRAWANLLEDASHMPYRNQAGFEQRGYKVELMEVP